MSLIIWSMTVITFSILGIIGHVAVPDKSTTFQLPKLVIMTIWGSLGIYTSWECLI